MTFLGRKTLLKIWVNHGLNLTTGLVPLSNIVLYQFSYYKMLFSFLFSSFPDQAYNWTNVPVYVMRRGALTVEFCSSRDRDEDNLLCEMEVTVPPQQRDPDVSVVCCYSIHRTCKMLFPFDNICMEKARYKYLFIIIILLLPKKMATGTFTHNS